MLFLLLLAGSRHHNPLDEIFFLQADTRGIPGAPDGIAHWTLYNVSSKRGGFRDSVITDHPLLYILFVTSFNLLLSLLSSITAPKPHAFDFRC